MVIGDILDDEGAQVVKEIEDSGGEALYVHLDVTSTAEWRKAVDDAVARFGKLNVVVNNAGIWKAGRVEDTTDEEWDVGHGRKRQRACSWAPGSPYPPCATPGAAQ